MSVGEVTISDINQGGFTVTFTKFDNASADGVVFKVWPRIAQESTALWHDAVEKKGNAFQSMISISQYGYVSGVFNVESYIVNGKKREKVANNIVTIPKAMRESIIGGYRILYWDSFEDPKMKILQEPMTTDERKLSSGTINKSLNSSDEFNFTVSMKNPLYGKLSVINGLVRVIDLYDYEIVFDGRILEINRVMTENGLFLEEVYCESSLGYLNDMTTMFEKRENKGPSEFLKHIIEFHNERVPKHKQFKLGNVNVPKKTDAPYLYCTFETTWEAIKNRLIEKHGGFITMRAEYDGNYIDYTVDVGSDENTPIKVGGNLKRARRNISLSEMMTQIVPIGGDVDTGEIEEGYEIIRPQVNIKKVTGKNMYIEDTELVKLYGPIRKIVTWSSITDPQILYNRGIQYLQEQKVALANWEVSLVCLHLLDKRYKKFKLGDKHPIEESPISGIEKLQIIELSIDITSPQTVDLTIGADRLTLSSFQLQQKAANQSMERMLIEQSAKAERLEQQFAKDTELSILRSELSQYETTLESYQKESQELEIQIKEIQESEDKTLLSYFLSQLEISRKNEVLYQEKINQTILEIERKSNS